MNYKIKVEYDGESRCEVTKCIDPIFDAKILLEGVGVLMTEIVKFTAKCPPDFKEHLHSLDKESVLKMMHDYLDKVGKDYEETGEYIKLTLPDKQ